MAQLKDDDDEDQGNPAAPPRPDATPATNASAPPDMPRPDAAVPAADDRAGRVAASIGNNGEAMNFGTPNADGDAAAATGMSNLPGAVAGSLAKIPGKVYDALSSDSLGLNPPAPPPAPAATPTTDVPRPAPVASAPAPTPAPDTSTITVPTGVGATTAPGTATVNGQTIDASDIKRLANTNVINAASFTNPGLGVASSEATGGASTPGLSADNVINRPAADPINAAYQDALANQQDAIRQAQDRMADVASGDWRSAAGTAAHNARVDLQSAMSSPSRTDRQIAAQIYQQRMNALEGGGLTPAAEIAQTGDRYQANVGEEERGALAAQERANATSLEREMRRPGTSQVPMADGTLGLLGADGVVRPAVDPNGNAIKTAKAPDVESAKIAADRHEQIAKTTSQLLQDDNLQRKPGSAPMSIQQARMRAYQINGATPPMGEWLAAAREANPQMSDKDLAARYKAKFQQ